MATIVCDVNETLLDLAGLDEPFAEAFGDDGGLVKKLWFARLLHMSLVMTTVGTWQDFGVVGRNVLVGVAAGVGHPIGEGHAGDIVGRMRELPAHPDVVAGLGALRRAGHSVVALTNSGQATAEAQLGYAGLDGLMDRIMSVEPTVRFKPDLEVYRHASEQLDTPPSELVMMAAHDWDCAGAMKAGWRSGFVARDDQQYSPLLQPPTWQASDVAALAPVLVDAL